MCVVTFKKSQADKQTNNFFSKKHLKWLFTSPSIFSTIQRHKKHNKKPLKPFCDGWTDGPTNKQTDQKVGYRVAQHATRNGLKLNLCLCLCRFCLWSFWKVTKKELLFFFCFIKRLTILEKIKVQDVFS